MTPEQEKSVSILKNHINVLISLFENAKEENAALREKEKELANVIQEKDAELAELQQKYNTLKMAKTIAAANEGAHEAKIKINRIVREIDKCIALLNR